MLQDVYERLLLHRLEPRWVGDELHIDVGSHAYTVLDHLGSVAVRRRATTAEAGPVLAVCDDPDEVLAVLGLHASPAQPPPRRSDKS